MDDLRDNPQIAELLEILDRNGLTKEKNEVNSLVDYIGSMENTLSDMMTELTAMRQEVKQIHDNTLRAKCSQLLQKTSEKVKAASEVVKSVKDNFIAGAAHAIQEFKLKGKDALIKAVEAMKIPKAIERLKDCFSKLSQNMERNASRMDTFRSELGEAVVHLKKAGRSLFGLTSKEYKRKEEDKGILAKFRNTFKKMSAKFADMEKSATKMLDKFRDSKSSVKTDLENLKKAAPKIKNKPTKDKSR